jgi:hypothetical protein
MMKEPRMPLRSADLRQAAYRAGTRPGDDLWDLLVELQRRRDGSWDEEQEHHRCRAVSRR